MWPTIWGRGGANVGATRGGGDAPQTIEQATKEVLTKLESGLKNEERQGSDGVRAYYISPWKDRLFGSPLEHRSIRPFPQTILRSFSQIQATSFQGLWQEIHRAWVTVDNMLYIWDYHTEENISQIDELDQLILCVGLVRPNADVFRDSVKTPESSMQVRRTNFRVATDGVVVRKVIGTLNGRIFLAGQDGNVYEVYYENEGDSFQQYFRLANKCRKINLTSWPMSGLPPFSLVRRSILDLFALVRRNTLGKDASQLVDVVVDDSRSILYTLSSANIIQVYDLGEKCDTYKLLETKDDVFRKAEIWCRGKHMSGEASRFTRGHQFRIISIHVIPTTESKTTHLLAVSNAGFRFYFQTYNRLPPGTVPLRPDRLDLVDIRWPPIANIWEALHSQADQTREAFQPSFVPNNSPTTYYQAHYANGVLILADGTEERRTDTVVSFCDEQTEKGGEIVSELSSDHSNLGLGKIRDIAEEPDIIFPINEGDRALDQLRYLVATSASADSDERPASLSGRSSGGNGGAAAATSGHSGGGNGERTQCNAYASDFRTMYESTDGQAATHLASRFGAALSESSQSLTSSRIFVILTSTGLHVVCKMRPVDVLLRLLNASETAPLTFFDSIFGSKEVCALLYSVAAQIPPDLGFPVGRQLLASPEPLSQTTALAERATSYLRSWYSRRDRSGPGTAGGGGPGLGGGQGGGGGLLMPSTTSAPGTGGYGGAAQASSSTSPPSSIHSDSYEGLILALGRLIRPIWFKPFVYDESPQIAPCPTLLFQPPELQAIIQPLKRLLNVVAQLYPTATRNPPRHFITTLSLATSSSALPLLGPSSASTDHHLGIALLTQGGGGGTTVDGMMIPYSGAPDAIDIEHAHTYVLYQMMDKTLQALELLNELAIYWRASNKVRLPLEGLRDMGFVDLVTSPAAQDAVKATMGALLRPDRTNSMSDRLTHNLSEKAFNFFSQGDQLSYEGKRFIAEAEKSPLDSSERVAEAIQAARSLVRAAAYWRTPADVDGLDGGLDRQTGQPRGRGVAHNLLRLAPTQEEVLDGIVDMALMASLNFGGKPYRPPGGMSQKPLTGALALPSSRVRLEEQDQLRALGEKRRAELKARCFLAVKDAIFWLIDPQSREPGPLGNPFGGYGLPQENLEKAAWRVITRALNSKDEELHTIIYTALLRDPQDGEGCREMLFSIHSRFLELFLDQQPGRLDLLRDYYLFNQRYAEAMELLERAALEANEEMKLKERVGLLTEAIQCAGLAQGTGIIGQGAQVVSAQKVQTLEDQVDVATLQLKVLGRLQEVFQYASSINGIAIQEEDRRMLELLDRSFVSSSMVFQCANQYTLWEECLELINMCNTDTRDMGQRVESFWRFIIFNELPRRAEKPDLQQWYDRKVCNVISRWWSLGRADRAQPGRYVGLPQGILDDPNDSAMHVVFDKIKGLARSMHLHEGRPRPAFPLQFIIGLLVELETEIDASRGLQPFPVVPEDRRFPHRTWRTMKDVGVSYIDLFAAHFAIYQEGRREGRPRIQLHALDAIRDLTSRWYDALREAPHGTWGSALIDTRQQSAVVRELGKLAQSSHAGNIEMGRVLEELDVIRERFQYFPEQIG